MKRLLSISFAVLMGVWQSTAWAAAGHIIDIQGQVTITLPNGLSQPATKDCEFDSGATISTGTASRAILRFEDEETIALRADTRFLVTRYRYLPSAPQSSFSEFALLKGALRALSGLIAKDRSSAFKLTTRTATIGVRGTEFMVADEGTVYSEVLSGEIQMDNSLGQQILKQGEAAEAPLGEAPKSYQDKDRLQKIFSSLRDLPLSNIYQLLNNKSSAQTIEDKAKASSQAATQDSAKAALPTATDKASTPDTTATPQTSTSPLGTASALTAAAQSTAATPATSTTGADTGTSIPRESLKLAGTATGAATSLAGTANTTSAVGVASTVGVVGAVAVNALTALVPSAKSNASTPPASTAAVPTPIATPTPVAAPTPTAPPTTPEVTATPPVATTTPAIAASSAAGAKPAVSADAIELEFWSSIRDSKNPADFQAYLDQFPQGRFHALAINRLKQLHDEATAAATTPVTPPPAPLTTSNEHRIPASVLRVHYHRREADYGDWGLQVAEEGGAVITRRGSSLEFTGVDDFGAYADIPLALIEQPMLDISTDKDGRRDACKQDRRWVLAQSHEIWIFGDRCDVYYTRP